MDPITLFGFVAVASMLVAYALEDRAPVWVLVFAIGCLASGVYGVLAKAWPFAFIESIWTVIAIRRWLRRIRQTTPSETS